MKKKNEKKMTLGAIKVARLTAAQELADKQANKHITIPTTTVHRTFDC